MDRPAPPAAGRAAVPTMPLISASSYRPPPALANGHLQTILPAILRRPPLTTGTRERIATPDDDFIDIDWARHDRSGERIAILTHGLEGSTLQPYMQGMAAALFARGWDVAAWNLRGCSGEPNRQLRFYHSGVTDDLECVVTHVLRAGPWKAVDLVGFSLGGNITLKFLGDRGNAIDPRLRRAVAFSVPCHLASCADQLARPENRIYMHHFLRSLARKVRRKIPLFPDKLDDHGLDAMRTFHQFDDRYTAPIHGFKDAQDYWDQCSAIHVLDRIAIPTLLVNARNDPFLAPPAYPTRQAETSPNLFLEQPASGGHVGFLSLPNRGELWSETRTCQFLSDPTPSPTIWR